MSSAGAGVYIHIPFCQARCSYCDFNTYAGLGHLVDDYVAALCSEIRRSEFHLCPRSGETVSTANGLPRALTVYFGGGTPSLLPTRHVERILAACRERWDVASDAEITLEANPGSVSPDSLRALRALGVNRLSLGVQSLDDDMLRSIGRLHDAAQARATYGAARQAGFDNMSLDFMYGLPGQTIEHWRRTLEQALALQPEHLSLYALTLEEHTPMAQQVATGRLTLPDDDSLADMYTLAEDMLEQAGYLHYEISNWATNEATIARHNTLYWQRLPYAGFGAGAHSFDGCQRAANVLHPRAYCARLTAGGSAVAERETISPAMARSETMFLGLRLLGQGVSDAGFLAAHGQPLDVYAPQIDELVRLGLLERRADCVVLTRRGRLLGNQVFIRFLD